MIFRTRLDAVLLGAALACASCDGGSSSSPPPTDEAPATEATAKPRAEPDAVVANTTPPSKPAAVVAPPSSYKPHADDPTKAEFPLENPEALAHFYDALARIDSGKKEVVQVVHLGASMIGADDLTSILRGKFQTRFGDGGAGMVLLRRFMTNYLHKWVKLDAKKWDNCYIGYLCDKSGRYGLGGVAFYGQRGAQTTIKTRKHELGDEVAHFEVWYSAEPNSADFEIRIDGGEPQEVETSADAPEDRWHAIDVAQGPHEIDMRVKGNGKLRAYGIVLETEGPGIVWDQFSWLGAFTRRMHGWDDAHIAGQVAHRAPELVAFTFGGNDSRRVLNGKLTKDGYVEEYLKGVKKVMAGKPKASCLIIAMTDRGRSLDFNLKPEHVETIVEGQRETAKQAGCAFFDTYAAMGGAGSLREWKKKGLAAGDLKHLNHAGREIFGGWLYDAIMVGYIAHRTGRK